SHAARRGSPGCSTEALQRGAERLPTGERRREQVAVRGNALERDRHREPLGTDILGQLVPAQRRRDRRGRLRAHGIDGGKRLAVTVLPGVEKDGLTRALQPLGG